MVLGLSLAEGYQVLKPLVTFIIGIVIYAILIFKFYKFVARKNIFNLDLDQYNTTEFGFLKKFISWVFYVIEYVILFPLFTVIWFGVFALLLTFLSIDPVLETTLLLSMALVASIRVCAYYNESLSQDLAKFVPFSLLGVFIIEMSFGDYLSGFSIFQQLPDVFHILAYYFVFIIVLEFVLRILHSIFYSFFVNDEEVVEEQ